MPISYHDLMTLARSRHSTRSFEERSVPLELVDKIIAAAQEAPSSCNHQMNRWIVISEPSLKDQLVAAGAPELLRNAPISIVQIFRMGWNHNKLSIAQAQGMAAQNLLLAANSLGLRSVIQAGIGDTDAIRKALGIGEGYFVGSIVSLGFSSERFPRPPRLPLEAVRSIDRFDEPAELRFPRRPSKSSFGDYSNAHSPDAVWDPEEWPLETIGCFRGLAVWHTSPARGVHRARAWMAEFEQEIQFFHSHVSPGHRVLEVLPFSAAYGARLVAEPGYEHLSWDVFELSPNHRAFIQKRCELEGVKSPDRFFSDTNLEIDLGMRWDRILLPGGLNHLPLQLPLLDFLHRHLTDEGLLLATFRNSFSFQCLLYLRQRRGQVWNFGPFKPLSPRRVERFLAPRFEVLESRGLSLTPASIGIARQGMAKRFCRTLCLALVSKGKAS